MSLARYLASLLNSSGQVPDAKLVALTASKLTGQVPDANAPSGSVIQVIDQGNSTPVSNSTATFSDGNCTATITPTNSANKILVIAVQELQVWNSGNPYATGRWKIQRNVNGGAFNDVYVDYSSSNGNVFAYDYGGSGINVYRPTSFMLVDSPNTTSAVIYKTQIAKGSNGGQLIGANSNSPGRMILMEISA